MHSEDIPDQEENIDVIAPTEKFFGDDTPLAEAEKHGGPVYEKRPQQTEMAMMIAEALENNHNLCIEAPTGVGKSFAYLVPSAFYASKNPYPVVISTETISLQEQLIDKDLPLISELLGIEFSATLAKGRSNYICKRRLSWLSGQNGEDYLPHSSLIPQVENISLMVETLKEGTKSELDFDIDNRVWGGVCCEIGNCVGPKCSFYRSCFYWKARRSWERADIIVANHALLFTDLKIKSFEDLEASLLPPYGAVIFDEAHLLEDCAANHLGLRVSDVGFRVLLNKLFDPEKAKGILMRAGSQSMELRGLVSDVHDAAEKFFAAVRDVMDSNRKDELRVLKPGIAQDSISGPMGKLTMALKDYLETEKDDDTKQEVSSLLQRCEGVHSEIYDFLTMDRESHVYWIEKRGRDREYVILNAAPLNINKLLQDLMFSKDFPVVLTSATLSVSGDLDYYRERIGFMNGPEKILNSPFDYERQVRMYLTRNIPMPKEDGYSEAICHNIKHFIEATHGKAFVLFTSYAMMQDIAETLRPFFSEHDINLHVQGEGQSRTAMLREFKKDIHSVIFGTSSFWMGVDVPGEALSNVIITKLPFAVPTHPLIQARSEDLQKNGKSSFMHYQLPEAILKLKQGVGRLIRSRTDSGIIVILDSRVLTKRYGNMFIKSLPKCQMTVY